MRLYLFNPENDLALADGGFSYCAPPAAMCIARDLATLPLWYVASEDAVVLPGNEFGSYYQKMSQLFELPKVYTSAMQSSINSLVPWGWSAQMCHRFKSMGFCDAMLPSDANIDMIRALSNRKLTIDVLAALHNAGIDTPPLPEYFISLDDAVDFVNNHSRCVVKAPWSGSGKGIMWGIGRAEVPMVHFCKGVIKRQGGVICEHFLDAKMEFAMEFQACEDTVEFSGYSLFTAENGTYTGNYLSSDAYIEAVIFQYINPEVIAKVKGMLCKIMQPLLKECSYNGHFGVDMMVYGTDDQFRLNPCMEINLRMNMGLVARRFYDKFVADGSKGVFSIKYFKNEGGALHLHQELCRAHPLVIENGRVVKGYLNLSPVNNVSHYMAYAVLDAM